MPQSSKHLIIGSLDAYSGKSTAVLGLAHCLQQQGLDIAYGKPLGTSVNNRLDSDSSPDTDADIDADVEFLAETLNLKADRLCPTLLMVTDETVEQYIGGAHRQDYGSALGAAMTHQTVPLVLLEGPGTLDEGYLYGLSLEQMAQAIDASIVLVIRFHSLRAIERLLAAKQRLGDRLVGVILNDVSSLHLPKVETLVKPLLENHGLPVVGVVPHNEVLKSVSVGELVTRLEAEVLCSKERMDLMVETLYIGAMNVNSALEYFRQGRNMAIVTGGDRTDLQLAALETSTQCLVLTGHIAPTPQILSRAEEMEIPILTVDLDTLSTVEIIEQAFGQVSLHDGIKREFVFQMGREEFYVDRLLDILHIPLPSLV
ncbi:phosphotransacetylase family protein [Prochlorothrix hollandica]|uniref:DRTGG domain-containing protein n=1 Tax=Prochlorothrix hollandica PCC 9006 = CALU 1027 TaxID=317619 RepID=A0A0M2Q4D1_PROHO|nr:phosphotransacetylase family protein [Prochlorothrix hollandica]KKJ01432.1 hypothetical protein PROH_03600 [Prochlorothrix hollandica PCC 9006 = CALU 1027]